MKVSEIRQSYLDFFRERGHTIVESSSLIPHGDPTLLFTNSGMNQFKDVFLGTGKRPYTRAADTQKCIRAGGKHNDLDTVGRDGYHQTFFEMLGNWSFGDYFKAEAIGWSWELLTKVWGIDKDRLWASVHHSDDEAAALWPKITGISPSRVLRFGKDNFWEMGLTGPCGPCTEIHVDRGPGTGPDTGINSGSERYIEIWNNVFIQYERKADGSLEPLPAKHVDTGMGLERVSQILQGVTSNYDTDVFKPIIAAIEQRAKVKYPGAGKEGTPHRAIADHVRCLSFAIADGAMPGADGRGSVLRRVLRRASRFFHSMGVREPAVKDIVPALIGTMGDAFPEIKQQQKLIVQVIEAEERKFLETLDRGVAAFEQERKQLEARGEKVLSGKTAFTMWDTHGFPVDVTEQMAEEANLRVDMVGFNELMEEAKNKARAAGKFKVDLGKYKGTEATAFTGYQHVRGSGKLLAADGKELVLDVTPFYAESGGQVGDTGKIKAVDGSFEFDVLDTQKSGQVWVHYGEFVQGDPGKTKPGMPVFADVDAERRAAIRRNHTGTHLLHWALRQVVGPNAVQKGSLVEPIRMRFDFANDKGLGPDELAEIERLVNVKIVENAEVKIEELPIKEAKEKGAIAMFGEKYGDRVRVIDIAGFSCEFCGGTHVSRTGDIGAFKLLSESAVQTGVRRIVAVTAQDAVRRSHEDSRLLQRLAQELKTKPEEVMDRLHRLQEEVKELTKKNKAQSAQALPSWDALRAKAEAVQGVQLLAASIPGASADALRQFGDAAKRQPEPFVAFLLGPDDEGKVGFVCALSAPLVAKGWHSRDLLKPVATLLGGGGGGKPEMSNGSGKEPGKVAEALELAKKTVVEKLG